MRHDQAASQSMRPLRSKYPVLRRGPHNGQPFQVTLWTLPFAIDELEALSHPLEPMVEIYSVLQVFYGVRILHSQHKNRNRF